MKYIQNTTSGFCLRRPFSLFAVSAHLPYASLAFFLSFLILLMCHYFRNEYNTSHIALLSFVLYLALSCFRNFFCFLKYFSYFLWSIGSIAIYICENFNVYLPEMYCDAEYAGSLPLACIFFECFFFILFHVDKYFQQKSKWYKVKNSQLDSQISHHQNMILIFLILCFIVNSVLFLIVAKKPAFVLGIDRGEYAVFYLPPIVEKIFAWMQFIFPTLIAMYAVNSPAKMSMRIVHIFFFALPFLLFSIWTGHKYGIFSYFFCSAIVPICAVFQNSHPMQLKTLNKKFLLISPIFVCILILFFTLTLYLQFKNSSDSFEISLGNRIAQQGQLWWKVFQQEYDCKFSHLDELKDELFPVKDAVLTNFLGKDSRKRERVGVFLDADHPYGIYKLMEITIPSKYYYSRLDGDTRYSALGFEIPFYYFGNIGAILFLIFFAVIIALLIDQFSYSCFTGKILYAIIFLRLLTRFRDAFFSGEWSGMFDRASILLIIVLIVLYLSSFFENHKRAFQQVVR